MLIIEVTSILYFYVTCANMTDLFSVESSGICMVESLNDIQGMDFRMTSFEDNLQLRFLILFASPLYNNSTWEK